MSGAVAIESGFQNADSDLVIKHELEETVESGRENDAEDIHDEEVADDWAELVVPIFFFNDTRPNEGTDALCSNHVSRPQRAGITPDCEAYSTRYSLVLWYKKWVGALIKAELPRTSKRVVSDEETN